MNGEQELYCKIYIDCDLTREQLIRILAELVNGNIDFWSIQTSICEIDVRKNKAFAQIQRQNDFDDFLYYSYYLDIEPIENVVPVFLYKESISKLLEALWLKGYLAVTACNFEDELPRKGGYKWRENLS